MGLVEPYGPNLGATDAVEVIPAPLRADSETSLPDLVFRVGAMLRPEWLHMEPGKTPPAGPPAQPTNRRPPVNCRARKVEQAQPPSRNQLASSAGAPSPVSMKVMICFRASPTSPTDREAPEGRDRTASHPAFSN